MGLLERLFERPVEARDQTLSLLNYAQWVELGLSNQTDSGLSISPSSAMKHSAVFACVRILAETLASLPLIMYERMDGGKRRAERHYLYSLLKDSPNEFMNSFELREIMQGHLATWGNAYAVKGINGAGRVVELFPLIPSGMREISTIPDGRRVYSYQMPSGEPKVFDSTLVWHIKGFGYDGKFGYSPIQLMREAIGLGMAAESFGARFFGNDARPGGVLQHPGELSKEAGTRLRENWETRHGGLSRSHKIALLEEGMTYKEIGLPPEDSQFIETRKFQLQEIARAFRVPPHMLADLDRATFSNIEHQSLEFVIHTMRPWFVRWEQSIKQQLMQKQDRDRYFPEFLIDALLRGDILSRYQAYAAARQNGWLSANDIRALENMNPVEGGDIYLVPLNMVPSDQAGGVRIATFRELLPDGRKLEYDIEAVENGNELESRQERSTLARRRIQAAHKPLFEDVLSRIYRREINDVGAAAKKFLTARNENEFAEWLQQFYESHRLFIIEQSRPAFQALAAAIAFEAGEEVNHELSEEAAENFVLAYLQKLADRQAFNSLDRILRALDDPDALAAIEAEFEIWRTTRPEITARDETVQVGNGVSRLVYMTAGFSLLKWRALGDSCPYCLALDGAVIDIQQSFVSEGSSFQPEGADVPLIPTVNIGHPPAHSGCDCLVVPGT